MDFVKIWPQRVDMNRGKAGTMWLCPGKNMLKMMRIPWNRCSTMQYSLGIGTLAYFCAKPCATILFLSSQWHSGEVGKINTNNPAKPIMIPNKPAADICRLHNQSAIIYQLYPRIWSYLIVKTLSTTLELMFKSHSIYPIIIHYIYIITSWFYLRISKKNMTHGPWSIKTGDYWWLNGVHHR